MIYTGLFLVGCHDEEEYSLPANEICDLVFTTNQGAITLNWNYVEDTEENRNRYVEIRYHDPIAKKDVVKTVSGYENSYRIENTGSKYGEYTFTLQPFSQTFAPGTLQTVKGTAKDKVEIPDTPEEPEEPEGPTYTAGAASKFTLTTADISIKAEDGTEKMSPDEYKDKLINGNANEALTPWKSTTAGEIFSIHVNAPEKQRFLKFSYNNANWSANNRTISELECYVKAEEGDEWTKIATLTEADGLKDGKSELSEPKEILAPFEFQYIKLRASKVKQKGTTEFKGGFAISEFTLYDVAWTQTGGSTEKPE